MNVYLILLVVISIYSVNAEIPRTRNLRKRRQRGMDIEQKVHCVFIHGAGEQPTSEQDIYNSPESLPANLKEYWGEEKLGEWTRSTKNGRKPCTSFAFSSLNTVHNGWRDEKLAKTVNRALRATGTRQRIFLHSMGNLIFFNAIKNDWIEAGKKIDLKTTNIYSLGAPIEGSELLNGIKSYCTQVYEYDQSKNAESAGMFDGFKAFGKRLWNGGIINASLISTFVNVPQARELLSSYCNINTGLLHRSYENLLPFDDPKLVQVAQKYTAGAICGTNPDLQDVKYETISKIRRKVEGTYTTKENDADVTLEVCQKVHPAAKAEDWKHSNKSAFWIAPYHHYEIKGYKNFIPEVAEWLESRE